MCVLCRLASKDNLEKYKQTWSVAEIPRPTFFSHSLNIWQYYLHSRSTQDNWQWLFGDAESMQKEYMGRETYDLPPNLFALYFLDCAASIADPHHLRCSDVAWTRSNSSIRTCQRIYLCSRQFYQQLFWNRKIKQNRERNHFHAGFLRQF